MLSFLEIIFFIVEMNFWKKIKIIWDLSAKLESAYYNTSNHP
jgi:hypothetical protein